MKRGTRVPSAGLLFGVALLFAGRPAAADTPISGTISTTTIWTTAGSPYVLTGDVLVQGAATPVLTIQAGVTVKFNGGASLRIGQDSAGELSAVGTSSQPIVFTANGSTTPGFWSGVHLLSHTTATTKITWATVSYGGYSNFGYNFGGIRVAGSPATLTNVTVQSGLVAGINVESGSPTIVSCTLKTNPWGLYVTGGSPTVNGSTLISSNTLGGVYITKPGSASFQTVTISSNTGYAISQHPAVTLGTVSSLTLSGNNPNAVEIWGNGLGIDTTTTWKSTGWPYVLTGSFNVAGASSPVLTIPAGVTLKFAQNVSLTIGSGASGGLQANGTSSQPIIFTANATNPSPGYWAGLQFLDQTLSTAKLSYATVSYGSNGIYVQNASPSSPTLQNLTLQSNTTGLNFFRSTPSIVNCNFVSNTNGLNNQTTTTLVSAGLNYWGAASGPSGSGPGTGQSVSAGVSYEPWLIAAPSTPNYLNTFTQKNRTFNPAISVNTTISSGSAQSAAWTITILNSGGSTIRTYSGTGTAWNAIWDGKDGSGNAQVGGTYTYQLLSGTATIAKGLTVIDQTRQLTVSGYAVAPAFFSPNGDGIQDTTTASAAFSFDDVAWTLRWKNPSNTVVKTVTGTGASLSSAWDGKNGGSPWPDFPYTAELTAVDGSASVVTTATATLDTTLPTATITSPASSQTLSNVYQNGLTNINVVGTASDTNVDHWQLDNVGFATIATGTANVTNATLGTWATLPVNNGSYTLKLQVWDKAGNTKTLSIPETLGNFKASENVTEFNGSAGGLVTYTSTVPFTLTETVYIKNSAGQTVKTLVSGVSRPAATYTDSWNGKNTSSVLQPDGPYFYVANLTAGTHSMTWDLSSTFINDSTNGFIYPGVVAFDPYNNQPRTISYNFGFTGQLSLGFSADNQMNSDCLPPDVCPIYRQYEESGSHTYYWLGIDPTGQFHSDLAYGVVVKDREHFAQNAVVLFGTKPSVAGVTATPTSYSPSAGAQTIGYTLATYQNQAATIKVSFLNQTSLSVLRTVTLNNVTPGTKTTTWDGKADNGMWVAPGPYVVTVTAIDSLGNQVSGQILTNVVY